MKIKYSKRETKNLGNYESATVEISIEDSVDTDIETTDQCFTRLRKFVLDRLSYEFNRKPETVKLSMEDVKNKIINLIEIDENNRRIVKSIYASYNVTKLQELNESQLIEVNKKLDNLCAK